MWHCHMHIGGGVSLGQPYVIHRKTAPPNLLCDCSNIGITTHISAQKVVRFAPPPQLLLTVHAQICILLSTAHTKPMVVIMIKSLWLPCAPGIAHLNCLTPLSALPLILLSSESDAVTGPEACMPWFHRRQSRFGQGARGRVAMC